MKIIPKLTEYEKSIISLVKIISEARGFMAVKSDSPIFCTIEELVKKGIIKFLNETRSGSRYYKINK